MPTDQFGLDGFKERLDYSIVIEIAFPTDLRPKFPPALRGVLGLNLLREAAISSMAFPCRNAIGVRLPNAECGLRQL